MNLPDESCSYALTQGEQSSDYTSSKNKENGGFCDIGRRIGAFCTVDDRRLRNVVQVSTIIDYAIP
ncbi:hypothetical protein SDJN02_13327, partial [Cucurbita argyrosperma subsp. argyrosperma]